MINKWQPQQLERIIEQLFSRNGYDVTGRNRHENGGDIDLVFNSFSTDTLMGDIYGISDGQGVPEIRVQAKNKKDEDAKDMDGIKQLTQMPGHEAAINILINMAQKFSEEARELAAKRGVILINGEEFASLLVKYGMDVIT